MDATNTQMKTVVYDDAIVRAFSTITVVWGVVAFLLGVIVAAQLSSAGVGRIDVAPWCTACSPELFHSYRRDGERAGRLGAVIGWRVTPG